MPLGKTSTNSLQAKGYAVIAHFFQHFQKDFRDLASGFNIPPPDLRKGNQYQISIIGVRALLSAECLQCKKQKVSDSLVKRKQKNEQMA